jgi:PAS domain S-box-containing protein
MPLPVHAQVAVDVPEVLRRHWPNTLDLLVECLQAPVALIMRLHRNEVEVFGVSTHSKNDYREGESFPLGPGLYCQKVVDICGEVLVTDALEDAAEQPDPRLARGLVCYWGLPLLWPTGKVFGTICVLDARPRSYSVLERRVFEQCRSQIELQLAEAYHEYLLSWLLQAQRDEHEPVEQRPAGELSGQIRAWEYWQAPGGDILYVSPSCQPMTGYPPDDFQRDPGLLSRIVFPEDRDLWEEHHRRGREAGERRRLEFRMLHRDGRIVWVEHVCRAVFNQQAEFLGTRATQRDITERVAAEQSQRHSEPLDENPVVERRADGSPVRTIATDVGLGPRRQAQRSLKASELLLRAILSSIPDHVAVLDGAGRILRVNEAWVRFARENEVADMRSVLPEAAYLEVCRSAAEQGDRHAGEALRGITRVLEGRQSGFELEYECSSRDVERWFVMTVVPLSRTGGGAVVIHTDITRQRLAEARTRRREQWLAETQSIAHLGSWEWHVPSNELSWSDEVYRILGVSPQAFDPTYEVLIASTHPEDRKSLQEALQRVLQDPAATFSLEHRVLRPDGTERYVHTQGKVTSVQDGHLLRMIGSVQDITETKESELKLRHTLQEVKDLRDRLRAESLYLQQEIKDSHDFREIIGQSVPLRRTLQAVERVATTGANVLLLGETGSGKELFARAIHSRSPRKHRPMIKLNCAALPSTLIESELFGHMKGSFTGALSDRIGRFEVADGGTLFLDEIGDLDPHLQTKLLRVLQEGELERVGSGETIRVDVRVIAATNRDLDLAIESGDFRPDLYYRLAVFPILIPPLRDRREDIPLLVQHFVTKKQALLGKSIGTVSCEVMRALVDYDWPGNVRELENVVERAMILSAGDTLQIEKSFFGPPRESRPLNDSSARRPSSTLEDIDRAHILEVLKTCNWKVKGPGNAADRLGLVPSTLRYRMKKLGIRRPS